MIIETFDESRRYRTDYKLHRPVLAPSRIEGHYDSVCVDVPFVFEHNSKLWMLHVGFDGQGYQTALACADTPEGPFTDVGLVLRRGEGHGWDNANAAGVWLLSEDGLFSTRRLKKYDGKYWMYYHSYPDDGYESGAAAIGMAWCEREDLSEWHRLPEPILTVDGAASWELGGLYKNCVVEHEGKYYFFYNAKDVTNGTWSEQIGLAVGDTPLAFVRQLGAPVLPVSAGGWDSAFTSDPFVAYDAEKQLWVMYYYGFNRVRACDGVAFSRDLYHWEKYPEPLIVPGDAGSLAKELIDNRHAHKPAMLWYHDTLYHYYCSCQDKPDAPPYYEYRTITVAANRPFSD